MISTWDALLGDDRERLMRDDLERTWARLIEGSQSSLRRLDRARGGGGEPFELLHAVWALHHALDGAVVVGGSGLGLVLHAATCGTEAEFGRARSLAARASRALRRARVKAVIESDWVAVALPGGRFFATDAQDGELKSLQALMLASQMEGTSEHG